MLLLRLLPEELLRLTEELLLRLLPEERTVLDEDVVPARPVETRPEELLLTLPSLRRVVPLVRLDDTPVREVDTLVPPEYSSRRVDAVVEVR